MADDTILCWLTKTTVADYKDMVSKQQKGKLAKFIGDRFTERYISPLEGSKEKNGFCIMAVSCLMIEALECFWEGLPETPRGEGAKVFKRFFKRNTNLGITSQLGGEFYSQVRCGILHQAETKGGWKITRLANLPLFDAGTKTINATKFHKELKQCLQQYCNALEKEDWDSELWVNFKNKMNRVCKNC